ncbi:hypothetical protein Q5L94_13795, partial [Idiomarina sp. Sol25]|uniref:hypothetical protein n=1 Tax=Idiomarina sp. Sol25 TaxID=3064000 RepID=UPI00294B61B4
ATGKAALKAKPAPTKGKAGGAKSSPAAALEPAEGVSGKPKLNAAKGKPAAPKKQPKAATATAPVEPIYAPARPAQVKTRHLMLMVSFL